MTRAVSLSLPSLLHYNYSTGDVLAEHSTATTHGNGGVEEDEGEGEGEGAGAGDGGLEEGDAAAEEEEEEDDEFWFGETGDAEAGDDTQQQQQQQRQRRRRREGGEKEVGGRYDRRCNELVHELMELPLFQSCNPTFNESLIDLESFSSDETNEQQVDVDDFDFVQHLRNVSLIMDCISCEKCKLWGKVQVLGVGTALKILLSERANKRYELERNEIIALFNLLAKLADSAHLVAEMSLLLTDPHHRAFEELTRPRLHQPANPSDPRGLASEKLLKMHAEL